MYQIRTIVESMREGSLGVSGPGESERARLSISSATTRTMWLLRTLPQRVTAPMRMLLEEQPELRVALSAPVDSSRAISFSTSSSDSARLFGQ